MNQQSWEETPRKSTYKREHYEKNKAYYKQYYQDNRERLNHREPIICECGMTVKCLWHHKKTKLHQTVMEKLKSVGAV